MKNNLEKMSSMNFDNVKVHYNSDKPAQLSALAYTKGNDVYVAPGQEKHLPHELGHVVQQARGDVRPTINVGGIAVNDNTALENAATAIGEAAVTQRAVAADNPDIEKETVQLKSEVVQKKLAEVDKSALDPMKTYQVTWNRCFNLNNGVAGTSGYIYSDIYLDRESEPTDVKNMSLYKDQIDNGGLSFKLLADDTNAGRNLTRMHLINHHLGYNTNNNWENMVLGTKADNDNHDALAETPVKNSVQDPEVGAYYHVSANYTATGATVPNQISQNSLADLDTLIADSTQPNYTPQYKTKFINWAQQACPTSLDCEVKYYHIDPATNKVDGKYNQSGPENIIL